MELVGIRRIGWGSREIIAISRSGGFSGNIEGARISLLSFWFVFLNGLIYNFHLISYYY